VFFTQRFEFAHHSYSANRVLFALHGKTNRISDNQYERWFWGWIDAGRDDSVLACESGLSPTRWDLAFVPGYTVRDSRVDRWISSLLWPRRVSSGSFSAAVSSASDSTPGCGFGSGHSCAAGRFDRNCISRFPRGGNSRLAE